MVLERKITAMYRRLHNNVSDKQKLTSCARPALVLGCLTVLGLFLAFAVIKRQRAIRNPALLQDGDGGHLPTDKCSMVLVESIPHNVKYEANVTLGIPLDKVWKDLISMTTYQLDIVSFYWTLSGEDIGVNSSSAQPGEDILQQLQMLPKRNVSVQVVTSIPSIKTNSTDLKILKQKGVQVRKVNFGRLTNGILHSKFWIVDKKHVFIGSPNMDWRALTEVKELGVAIFNCSRLARDLHKIFLSYWVMGKSQASVPVHWPSKLETSINKDHPLLVKDDNVSSKIYLAGSPPAFCPQSRTQDLEAIISIISEAQQFIDIAVMEYLPTVQFEHPRRYWPLIDDAIRAAAYERMIKVRMLISCGWDSNPAMLLFLQSLASMDSPQHNISIQLKLYIIPKGNQSYIPHTRINHNKYMVTDKVAYIGTSNWSGAYFQSTAGVGLVISQSVRHPEFKAKTLQDQIRAVFDRDWYSEFAMPLADLNQQQNCALLK